MAASPIALFPFMRTLATVNPYRHFWTYYCTNSATGTLTITVGANWEIATSVYFIGSINNALGTEMYANHASLAKRFVDFNASLFVHNKLSS